MLTEAARLDPDRGTMRHLTLQPPWSSTMCDAPRARVHPAVARVAIWLALGLAGWAVVASVTVAGFRILG